MQRPFRTKPPRSGPPPVAKSTASIFAKLAQKTKFVDPAIAQRWTALAGDRLATISRPGRMTGHGRGKTLEIHVRDGAAAAEVQMQTDALIARLNEYLGPGVIGRITIRQSGGTPASSPKPTKKTAATMDQNDESPLGTALASFQAAVKRRNS